MPRVYPPLEQKPSKATASTNTNGKKLGSSLIESIAGFTGGTISTLVVHPFDIVKTRLQGELRIFILRLDMCLG
jgi:solute carrier family 25 folate transporter 32